MTPLAPDRYKMQVTIGSETLEKLRLAKDLLRHAVPSGDEAVILDRALTALLADLAQSKFAATERPRPTAAPRPGSRTIPAEVKRRVWVRDLGTLRVRRADRPAVQRAGVPGVPSRASPSRSAERPRSRTSSCAAAATTRTRRGCGSGAATATTAWRLVRESCDVRPFARNSFRNELPPGSLRAGAMTSPRSERGRVDSSFRNESYVG